MGSFRKVGGLVLFCSVLICLSGCPVVRATGDTVQAVGEGAGHAVSGTGRAITDAAD